MKLLLLAVGTRMPGWVEAGYTEYAKRMPRELAFDLVEVKAESRTGGKPAEAAMAAEAQRLEDKLPSACRRIVLDEHGQELSTRKLADRLGAWMQDGRDVAIIVGGPDGLDPAFKAKADETFRLSGLTLPHALVRVLLAEALYRAASLLRGHPYHRE